MDEGVRGVSEKDGISGLPQVTACSVCEVQMSHGSQTLENTAIFPPVSACTTPPLRKRLLRPQTSVTCLSYVVCQSSALDLCNPDYTCNSLFSTCLSEKAMAPHSSTRAWKIQWTEEPGGLQSMGSLRVGPDWVTSLSLFTFTHWRRKWQPTPVFLPGESQGQQSLVGCRLWGHTESDTTEAT